MGGQDRQAPQQPWLPPERSLCAKYITSVASFILPALLSPYWTGGEVKRREAVRLVQVHPAAKWQSKDLDLCSLPLHLALLPPCVPPGMLLGIT